MFSKCERIIFLRTQLYRICFSIFKMNFIIKDNVNSLPRRMNFVIEMEARDGRSSRAARENKSRQIDKRQKYKGFIVNFLKKETINKS